MIYFDDKDNLREKLSDSSKVKPFIDQVERHLQIVQKKGLAHEEDMYFLYGVLGNVHRIYGQPERAIHFLTLALKLAIKEENVAKRAVCMIRLGEALKYNDDHEKALENFTEAMKIIMENDLDLYKDFALQHKGKCFIEMKRWNEAEQCFLEALTIRQSKGDRSLIQSTQRAIEFVNNHRR